MQVCAVVLTCNRVDLLKQCLDHLEAQTRPPDHVIVVDNGSTDGTADLLAARDGVEALTMGENIGAAGGYAAGERAALDQGFDWVWLLDDDAFAHPEALEALLAGAERAPRRPDLLTSAVRWHDGRLHPMNRPWLRVNRRAEFAEAAARGLVLIRTATSVSTMVTREALVRHGFTRPHYEVWIDDIEWTGRILRDGAGYLVPESITVHATPAPRDTVADPRERFYFKARNQLWLLREGKSLGGLERFFYGVSYLRAIRTYVTRSPSRARALKTVFRGVRDGLRREPR
jgi:rhamnopyranosyl-N-acetylglucosaminyl-diphospho-decaprenol beta-1,3/1,4-galactofuranosyltransferase